VPSSKGVSAGPMMTAFLRSHVVLVMSPPWLSEAAGVLLRECFGLGRDAAPAYQVMTLSAIGLALTPAGGSVCMRLKSRISLLRAAVDILVACCGSQNDAAVQSLLPVRQAWRYDELLIKWRIGAVSAQSM
jgi:hypothetical protein